MGDGSGDVLYVINLYDKRLDSVGTAEGGWNASAAVYLTNRGHAYPYGIGFVPGVEYPGEWSHYNLEISQAALYQVRATVLSRVVSPSLATWVGPGTGDYVYSPRVLDLGTFPYVDPGSDALDTWLSLSTTRHWGTTLSAGIAIDAGVSSWITKVRYEIRQISTGTIQASATMTFHCKGYLA